MLKNNTNTQTGATLFIGLILLLAISIVSLVAMRTSILDLTIANNKQQFTNTFEAAEQIVNTRLSTLVLNIDGTEAMDSVLPDTSLSDIDISSRNNAGNTVTIAQVDSEIRFRLTGGATGNDLSAGASAYHFQMDTEAMSPGRGTNSNHRVGFYIVAPPSN